MSNVQVLIVEDQNNIAWDLKARVGSLGYQVWGVAVTATEAFDLVRRTQPDLVLMDIGLKGPMDGVEAAASLRASYHIPIVFIAAHSDAATQAFAGTIGAYRCIRKPFDDVEIRSVIDAALHTHRLACQSTGAAGDARHQQSRRILLVDDEVSQASILKSGLARLPQCELAVAYSGTQALAMFDRQPFDLMITDYRMPGMDGLVLAARVRNKYPATQIIVLTAHGRAALSETAECEPDQVVLEKPVDLNHIRFVVMTALNKIAGN